MVTMSLTIAVLALAMLAYGDIATNCGAKGLACCDVNTRLDSRCSVDQGQCENGICCMGPGDPCVSVEDCCRSTPHCFQGVCSECGENVCKSNDDCCAGAPYCLGGSCVLIPGRPYNLLNADDKTGENINLRANIIMDEDNDKCDHNLLNDDTMKKHINSLVSEHAAIATFNKFSIELMNLAAPLWFVELAQNAALDEINHTKIMLNILNKKLASDVNETCIQITAFPNHKVEFNGDCNAVSLDVVNGGCFGETVSSISTMSESIKINELYSVAMDEVRHSALAWISAKWMINNCENIDISQYEWWQNILSSKTSVIAKIFKVFWNFEGDYQSLYKIVNDMLNQELMLIN